MAAGWRAGVLWWLLDYNQYRTYLAIRRQLARRHGRFTLKWARRTGKTWLLMLVVIEEAIRHAGHRYNVAAATKESLREFVWPAVYSILATCPPDLRTTIKDARTIGRLWFCKKKGNHTCQEDQEHTFIVLAGCNDARSVEHLRGPYSHGNVLEEIGALPDAPGLGYIQNSILGPQLLTTGGWRLRAGTPPKSSGHEAAAAFERAEQDADAYSYATLYDNPRLTPTDIQEYLSRDADDLGMTVDEYLKSADYRREWLAMVETDPTDAVLPPCTPEKMWGPAARPPGTWTEDADPSPWQWTGAPGAAPLVRIMPDVPMFRDRYVAMDLGFHPHFTHILFAYWDYERQVLVIEDELQARRLNDSALARLIGGPRPRKDGTPNPLTPEEIALVGPTGKEAQLWGGQPPYLRVADNNYPMTLSELSVEHGITFIATAKDELRAAIVQVCRWIRDCLIAIHPRVKHLIAQVRAAIWNKARTEFAESKEYGHYDAVAALIYLVRNVIPNMSRVPHGWGFQTSEMHRPAHSAPLRPELNALLRGFGV